MMNTMKVTRRMLSLGVALVMALTLCVFSAPSAFAAENTVAECTENVGDSNKENPTRGAGGYASTWNAVSGQGNFTLTPSSYASSAKLTLEATNYTTTDVYMAVTSNYNGRTIWAGFLNSSTMQNTKWFSMVNGETYNVYYVVVNGSAVLAASLWS